MLSAATHAYAFRPFDSTDAAVAEAGRCEIELGPVGYLSEVDERVLVAPALILNFGISGRWEVVVEGKNTLPLDDVASGGSSLRDNAASVKGILRRGILQDRTGASVAVEISTLLPAGTGERGIGQAFTGIVSQRWLGATLHVNGTLALTRAHEFGAAGGLIIEGPARWTVRPVGELVIERATDTDISALIGAIWDVHEHLSIDTGWRTRARGSVSHEFRAGMTFSFDMRGSQSDSPRSEWKQL
ncbi:MAG TPA: hypothetical protein VFP91_02765 [Vicinamibacterales bacterium]|nr:hypothetical protein [Vicinamibacterales bacterium]